MTRRKERVVGTACSRCQALTQLAIADGVIETISMEWLTTDEKNRLCDIQTELSMLQDAINNNHNNGTH